MRSEGLPYDVIKEELQRWYNAERTVAIQQELSAPGRRYSNTLGLTSLNASGGWTLPKHAIRKPFAEIPVRSMLDRFEPGLGSAIRARLCQRIFLGDLHI